MIDILLATYNGARYIRELIESLQVQTYGEWKLLVHDDGSSDETVSIIREMAAADERIVIFEDGVALHSPGKNFLHLLRYSTAPYIMFCDQDDIWMNDKVSKMFEAISTTDKSVPQVVYSNASVWTPSEGVKGPATLYFADRLEDLLFLNSGVQGASAIFNAKARGVMMEYPLCHTVAMHDHLLQLVCTCFGQVSVIPESLMYYREHPSQATGKTKTRIFSIAGALSRVPVLDRRHMDAVKSFRECYSYALTDSSASVLDNFIALDESSLFKRLKSVRSNGFTLYGSRPRLVLKILLRPFIKKSC